MRCFFFHHWSPWTLFLDALGDGKDEKHRICCKCGSYQIRRWH